jgi:chromate transporter
MAENPSLNTLFRTFARIGFLSFGGPAAQISLMHNELVDRHGWLSEDQFLKALSFCMLLPGPEAMQLATYAGWRLRGVTGGIMAGLLFVLPGAAVIFALALGYAFYGDLPLIHAVFAGIQAAVVVIVLQALWKLANKALKGIASWILAASAFIALFFLSVPFPIIVLAAAVYGWVFVTKERNTNPTSVAGDPRTLRTVLIWGGLWIVPILLVWILDQTFLLQVSLFFSKLAIVTFGGAYAVLAYMTQAVVDTYGWLTTAEMIDALGLAETTPGPLILVTQFVGFVAGIAEGGVGLAFLAGLLTLWVTFCPCFLWIFAGAPYVETLLSRPRLKAALDAISASVVGVILNLSLWFALHVLFEEVSPGQFGPTVNMSSVSWVSVGFVLVAMVLLLVLRMPMIIGLAVMGAIGCAFGAAGYF